jgi:hypothetical protein
MTCSLRMVTAINMLKEAALMANWTTDKLLPSNPVEFYGQIWR